MIIRVQNLRLRLTVGLNEWERITIQEVVVNLEITAASEMATKTDDIADTVDYRKITKRIIADTADTKFLLIERLGDFILDVVFEEPHVASATVRIDKPNALRFADSVSIELTRNR